MLDKVRSHLCFLVNNCSGNLLSLQCLPLLASRTVARAAATSPLQSPPSAASLGTQGGQQPDQRQAEPVPFFEAVLLQEVDISVLSEMSRGTTIS